MTVHDAVGQGSGPATSPSSGPGSGQAPQSSQSAATKPSGSLADGPSTKKADLIFRSVTIAAGLLVVATIVFIGIELTRQAIPALQANTGSFFGDRWNINVPSSEMDQFVFGVLDMLRVTVLSSVFALLLAVPVSIGIATFLVQYAPKKLSRPFSAIIDLLAAVPSIIYGVWGIIVLGPFLQPIAVWLNENLGWFPLFSSGNVSITANGTIFVAGVVLAIMITPIITSMTRETIRQTPSLHQEAAMALGATKWEKIRMTCFPYARSGMIAASMLALGRALGETIALMIVLSTAVRPSTWSLFDGGYTFASRIALDWPYASGDFQRGALIAAGLALFLLTFAVTAAARMVSGGKVNS